MKVTLYYFPPPIEQEFELPEECPNCKRPIDSSFIFNAVVMDERVRNAQEGSLWDGTGKRLVPSEDGDPGDYWMSMLTCSWCATELAEAVAPAPLEMMAHDLNQLEHNPEEKKR